MQRPRGGHYIYTAAEQQRGQNGWSEMGAIKLKKSWGDRPFRALQAIERTLFAFYSD